MLQVLLMTAVYIAMLGAIGVIVFWEYRRLHETKASCTKPE
jgi:multisubunit Na+/H+ antiporter MnhG subunit